MKIATPTLSIIAVFDNLITACKIKMYTLTLIPLNMELTTAESAKLFKLMAIITMMNYDGVTTPNVAMAPPRLPFLLMPINVAVLIAMAPGVVCPIAK